jgi:hypothetical protein
MGKKTLAMLANSPLRRACTEIGMDCKAPVFSVMLNNRHTAHFFAHPWVAVRLLMLWRRFLVVMPTSQLGYN